MSTLTDAPATDSVIADKVATSGTCLCVLHFEAPGLSPNWGFIRASIEQIFSRTIKGMTYYASPRDPQKNEEALATVVSATKDHDAFLIAFHADGDYQESPQMLHQIDRFEAEIRELVPAIKNVAFTIK